VDPRTGEVVLEANERLQPARPCPSSPDAESQVGSFEVLLPERDEIGLMMSA
jgi:hypothetical protein